MTGLSDCAVWRTPLLFSSTSSTTTFLLNTVFINYKSYTALRAFLRIKSQDYAPLHRFTCASIERPCCNHPENPCDDACLDAHHVLPS